MIFFLGAVWRFFFAFRFDLAGSSAMDPFLAKPRQLYVFKKPPAVSPLTASLSLPQDAVDPAPPVHPHRPLGGARRA